MSRNHTTRGAAELKLFFGLRAVLICGFAAPKHVCSYHLRILFFLLTHSLGQCVIGMFFFFFLARPAAA